MSPKLCLAFVQQMWHCTVVLSHVVAASFHKQLSYFLTENWAAGGDLLPVQHALQEGHPAVWQQEARLKPLHSRLFVKKTPWLVRLCDQASDGTWHALA